LRVALGLAGIIILYMGLDAVVEAGNTTGLPQVLTVEEVADLMRVDRKTAYAAIAEGGVPGVRRIGRCIRVSRDVLLRWLEQGDAKLSRVR
jgi:excisionase family DNA binding protein